MFTLFKKYYSGNTFGQGMNFAGAKQFALTPSPGPPFLLTSANNGLSVDPITFKIVLGQSVGAVGDPAQLLDNRQIPTNFFNVDLLAPNGSLIRFDTNTPQVLVNDPAGTGANAHYEAFQLFMQGTANGAAISLDLLPDPTLNLQGSPGQSQPQILWSLQAANQYQAVWNRTTDLFHLGSTLSPVEFVFDDNGQAITGQLGGNTYFSISLASNSYQLGDLGSALNGSLLSIDDSIGKITITGSDGINRITQELNPTPFIYSVFGSGGNDAFLIDFANHNYQLGDRGPSANGNGLSINDTAETSSLGDIFGAGDNFFQVTSRVLIEGKATDPLGGRVEFLGIPTGGSELFSIFTTDAAGKQTFNSIDGVNGIWRATRQGGGANGTFLRMSDFNQQVDAGTDTGPIVRYFLLDIINQLFQIGDIDTATNGTALSVNPTNTTVNYGDIFGLGQNVVSLVGAGGSETFIVINAGGFRFVIDPVGQFYKLGDLSGLANGNTAVVDDGNSELQIDNLAHNLQVRINGVLGFTGTVTPVTTITVNGGIVTNVA